jgi:hypothetical protein
LLAGKVFAPPTELSTLESLSSWLLELDEQRVFPFDLACFSTFICVALSVNAFWFYDNAYKSASIRLSAAELWAFACC